MRTRRWMTWLACTASVMLMVACGGGGSGSGSGGASPADTTGGNASTPAAKTYSVVLNQISGEVTVGGTMPLAASVVDNDGNDVTASAAFSWTTSSASVAAVGAGSAAGSAVVTGVGTGTATIGVRATVVSTNNVTIVLPQVTAAITVVAAGTTTYTLALPYPVLSMTDGQTLPVKASLIDSDGADRSAAASGWTWASSTSAVQVTGAANVGTLRGVNANDTVAQSVVSVSVTAPNNSVLKGSFLVSVVKSSVASYRLVLSQNGAQINALNVLNGYPQTYASRVVRNDEADATADFTGLWTFTTTSPSLTVSPDTASRLTTLSTSRANGVSPLQGILSETASSLTLTPKPRANLLVTEQPTWALIYSGPNPLVVPGVGATIAVRLMHRGIDEGITACGGSWAWTSPSSNVVVSQSPIAPNSVSIMPISAGPFTVTASCTAGTEAMPLSITIPGTAH